jgi:hypothetical protein
MIDITKLTHKTFVNYDLQGHPCTIFYYDGKNITECEEPVQNEFYNVYKPSEMDKYVDIFLFRSSINEMIDILESVGIYEDESQITKI